MKIKNNTKILILTTIILIIIIPIIFLIRNITLGNNVSLTSLVYKIEDKYITNISPNTNPELYYKYFDLENCSIKVTDPNNQNLTSKYIYTGSKTIVYDNDNNIINTYTNIVTGDITNDGLVNDKDLNTLANYLIEENNLKEEYLKSVDLNDDSKLKINDLTLLEEYLNSNYKTISLNKEEVTLMTNENIRLIANITPNIVLDQNAIWTSSNESVAKVNQAGVVTAYEEGEAIITATTKDGSLKATTKIIVDNTMKLSSSSGTVYIGGNNLKIDIKALDYNNLTCKSKDESLATCSIENNQLIITGLSSGTTTITVSHPNYGTATYEVKVISTYLNILPKSWCFITNSSYGGGKISIINAGTVSVKSISNNQIITHASAGKNYISITSGSQTGDAEVVFTESNGNQTSTFKAYVYKLSLTNYSGTTSPSENLTTKIISSNTGDLTCISSDSNIANCSITDDELTIIPISSGTVTITVKGNKCGTATYTAIIEEVKE